MADARAFSLAPRQFVTPCGGLFLFVPDLVRLDLAGVAQDAEGHAFCYVNADLRKGEEPEEVFRLGLDPPSNIRRICTTSPS